MINLTESLKPNKDIKLNGKSIKGSLARWLKSGVVVSNNDYLTIRIGCGLISLKTANIQVLNKKPSREELLLKSMEVFE